jgi:pimeloyl-ACP methyl ester carboxylesterase
MTDASKDAPLLFLPGLFIGQRLWRGVLESLTGRRVVTIESSFVSMPLDSVCIGELAAVVKKRLNDLAIPQVTLIGASFGGIVAIEVARRYPACVRHLILSGAPGFNTGVHAGVKTRASLTHNTACEIAARMFWDRTRIAPDLVDAALSEVAKPGKFIRMLRLLKGCKTYDTPAALAALSVRTDLVWGDHDSLTPIDPWRLAAEGRRNWNITLVHNTGHSPMLERPDEFNMALQRVLAQASAAA